MAGEAALGSISDNVEAPWRMSTRGQSISVGAGAPGVASAAAARGDDIPGMKSLMRSLNDLPPDDDVVAPGAGLADGFEEPNRSLPAHPAAIGASNPSTINAGRRLRPAPAPKPRPIIASMPV